MDNRAWIRLVENSTQTEVSLEDVKERLERYVDMASRTGRQLGWSYEEAAFPYTMEERTENGNSWLILKGKDPKMYRGLVIGVKQEPAEKGGHHTIQILIPPGATHGDKSKANEFCRYLAKAFQGSFACLTAGLCICTPENDPKNPSAASPPTGRRPSLLFFRLFSHINPRLPCKIFLFPSAPKADIL